MGTEPRAGSARVWWLLAIMGVVAAPAAASGQGAGWAWLAWKPAESHFATDPAPAFLDRQLSYERVQTAKREKRAQLAAEFEARGIPYPPAGLYLRVFKRERIVEAWVRPLGATQHTLFKTYPMCVLSGTLGPKRKRGDLQVPEGFYQITNFNPVSDYYLSLGISYPNRSDLILGAEKNVGGNIFIHGGCKTIGCVPLTNDQIKEVYWLAVEAKATGQQEIPVHIFPTRMDAEGLDWLSREFDDAANLQRFWSNLSEGYRWFEETRQIPLIAVDRSGRYLYGEAARIALASHPVPGGPALIGRDADAEPVGAMPLVAPTRKALLGEAAAAARRPVAQGLIEVQPDEDALEEGLLADPAHEAGAGSGPPMVGAPLVGAPFVPSVAPVDSSGTGHPRGGKRPDRPRRQSP